MSKIYCGDVFDILPKLKTESIHCCITSPPYYGLRDYGMDGQIGQEETPEWYMDKLWAVFEEVKRILRPDGTLWLNLGDTYQDKELLGIPWQMAFRLQRCGWFLRQEIIWSKGNPMPESVSDRCTRSHEHIFLFSKSKEYYFDSVAIQEPASTSSGWAKQRAKGVDTWKYNETEERVASTGQSTASSTFGVEGTRIKRSVWEVNIKPFKGLHFAPFPPKLITPCVLAGTSKKGCCDKCGTPFNRLVDKTRKATRPGKATKVTGTTSQQRGNRDPQRHVTERKTLGWVQGCACLDNTAVPCTVLDPFFGAGTTGVVCQKYGREYVGVELNPEYVRIAKERIRESPSSGFGLLGK